jgi:hypothetical protein
MCGHLGLPLPILSALFAKLSPDNPLHLTHLRVESANATLDKTMLPHLTQLTSFHLEVRDGDVSAVRSIWTSFLASGIKLTEVVLEGIVTEEATQYLSSYSGLTRLNVERIHVPLGVSKEHLRNIFFMEVLPKHVDSLQDLWIFGDRDSVWVSILYPFPCYMLTLTSTRLLEFHR